MSASSWHCPTGDLHRAGHCRGRTVARHDCRSSKRCPCRCGALRSTSSQSGLATVLIPALLTVGFVFAWLKVGSLFGGDYSATEFREQTSTDAPFVLTKHWYANMRPDTHAGRQQLLFLDGRWGVNRKDEVSAGAVALTVIMVWRSIGVRGMASGMANAWYLFQVAVGRRKVDCRRRCGRCAGRPGHDHGSSGRGKQYLLFAGLRHRLHDADPGRMVRPPLRSHLEYGGSLTENGRSRPFPRSIGSARLAARLHGDCLEANPGKWALALCSASRSFSPLRQRSSSLTLPIIDHDEFARFLEYFAVLSFSIGLAVAMIVGIGVFLYDVGPGLSSFWRSRPINPNLWFWIKFSQWASRRARGHLWPSRAAGFAKDRQRPMSTIIRVGRVARISRRHRCGLCGCRRDDVSRSKCRLRGHSQRRCCLPWLCYHGDCHRRARLVHSGIWPENFGDVFTDVTAAQAGTGMFDHFPRLHASRLAGRA